MGTADLSGTLSATGQSSTAPVKGKYNLSLSGTWTGTAKLQRSFDNGSTWVDVYSTTSNIEQLGEEIEEQIVYRVDFARSTGALVYRVSR